MFSIQRLSFCMCLLSAFVVSQASRAGILVATEPTQILNNLELVASYAEQAEQTLTQINQYQLMLRNLIQITPDAVLAKAAQQLWRNAEMAAAFKNLRTMVNAGQKLEWTVQNMGRLFKEAHPGYGAPFDFKRLYQNGSANTLNALEHALTVMGAQGQHFNDEQQWVQRLQSRSQTARGQMQALQAGNEIGVAIVGQMQQLRQLQMAQLQAQTHFIAAQQDVSDAQHHGAERVFGGVQSRRLLPLQPENLSKN